MTPKESNIQPVFYIVLAVLTSGVFVFLALFFPVSTCDNALPPALQARPDFEYDLASPDNHYLAAARRAGNRGCEHTTSKPASGNRSPSKTSLISGATGNDLFQFTPPLSIMRIDLQRYAQGVCGLHHFRNQFECPFEFVLRRFEN